jgi:hypothetical protein
MDSPQHVRHTEKAIPFDCHVSFTTAATVSPSRKHAYRARATTGSNNQDETTHHYVQQHQPRGTSMTLFFFLSFFTPIA